MKNRDHLAIKEEGGVTFAQDSTAKYDGMLQSGHVYVAPPDQHLQVENGRIRLTHGAKENRHRPSVDTLFRSAAHAYGPAVIGVILTGMLDDGTAGLDAIKRAGGRAIVQDPSDALFSSMPANAIANVAVDVVLPLRDIASYLERLAHTELTITAGGLEAVEMNEKTGPSVFSCPDCGGVLFETESGVERLECRVGHAFTPASMQIAQHDRIEEALWSAIKTLEESAELSARLAAQQRERGLAYIAERFDERRRDALTRAAHIREVLERPERELETIETQATSS